MITVRDATYDDLDWIHNQLKEFSKFINSKYQMYEDAEYVDSFLRVLMDQHVFLIADILDVGPVGFICGTGSPHPFNPNIDILTELAWWVDEQHRGSRAGLLLLNEFAKVGKAKFNWVVMSLEVGSPVNEKTLIRRGFMPKEKAYLMEV